MILDRIFGPARSLATWNDERWWMDIFTSWGGGPTASGITVNEDTAMNCATVRRAVALKAGAESGMPIHVFERQSDTERKRLSSHPVERLLNDEPNPMMDGVVFRELLDTHAETYGNGYAEIIRAGGRPVQLWPIHPSLCRPDVEGNTLFYRVRDPDTQGERILPPERIFHLKNLGGDGLCGWSTVRRARETIGLAVATERYGGSFFGNGCRPGGFLKHPQKLSEKARDNLRKSMEQLHGGADNAHKLAILEEGMEWILASSPPEDAQFLTTRKFNVVEIGRWFDVPPHLLYDMDSATDNNTEKMGLEFLVFGMMRWLLRWEKEVCRKLFTDQERRRLYAEHQTGAMARADITTRFNAYAVAHSNGWMSVNDIRRLENQPSIGPAGDIYLLPGNMLAAEEVMRRVLEPPKADPAPAPGRNGDGQAPEPPSDTPNPTPTGRMNSTNGAHRRLLADALGRLARKEALAARQAAKKPGEFLDWLDGHCEHHRGIMAEVLGPVVAATVESGQPLPPADSVALSWTRWTRNLLLEVSGQATAKTFPAAVETALDCWPRRVAGTVRRLFDEDQPRDDGGQWTDGGGGSGGKGDGDKGDGGDGGDTSAERAAPADRQAAREREDEEIDAVRQKEDDEIEARREAEDEALHDAEIDEDEAIDKARAKEDRAKEKAEAKEDDAADRRRQKEEDAIDRKEGKEFDRMDRKHEKENDAVARDREKERAEIAERGGESDADRADREARWEKQDRERKERQEREFKEIHEKHEKERSAVEEKYKREEDERTSRWSREDADKDGIRNEEDKEREAARQRKRERIAEARQKEDDEQSERRDREDQARREKRDREDKELTGNDNLNRRLPCTSTS